jgi:hypothetical protein
LIRLDSGLRLNDEGFAGMDLSLKLRVYSGMCAMSHYAELNRFPELLIQK